MADFAPEEAGPRLGAWVTFWAWAGAIGLGLALMIVTPLMGR